MCDCLSQLADKLKERNLTLAIEDGFQMQSGKAKQFYGLPTKKANGHRGQVVIIEYCPICGERIFIG